MSRPALQPHQSTIKGPEALWQFLFYRYQPRLQGRAAAASSVRDTAWWISQVSDIVCLLKQCLRLLYRGRFTTHKKPYWQASTARLVMTLTRCARYSALA